MTIDQPWLPYQCSILRTPGRYSLGLLWYMQKLLYCMIVQISVDIMFVSTNVCLCHIYCQGKGGMFKILFCYNNNVYVSDEVR